MFLFYSGYGIYESIKKRGQDYIKTIPIKRILITLINFDVALLAFLILGLFLKNTFSVKTILLSLIGWGSLGNSNWYIFSMIGMYLITYISFIMFDKDAKKALKLNWLLVTIFILFLALYRKSYWYNTLFCYPLGLTFSNYKEKIENLLKDNKKYLIALIISILSFYILYKYSNLNWIYYEITAMAFCIMIVLVTLKFSVKNKILNWFGQHLFWFYILHRIPMILLTELNYQTRAYRFAALSFIISIILAFAFKAIMDKVDKIVLNKLIK